MILYLAGKMTGTADMGRRQFNEAEEWLANKGHIVLNPARLPLGLTEDSYMGIGLRMLDAAEAIYLLQGWETSKGAKIEKAYAEYQGKKVLYER